MLSLYHHLVNDKPDKKAPPLAEIMAKDTEFIPRLVERLLRNHKEFYELEVGEYPVVEDE